MKNNRYAPDEEYLRALLRDRRKELGITQEALADALSKHQSFVSKYESGERLLTFVEAISICHALDIDPASLLKDYLARHET